MFEPLEARRMLHGTLSQGVLTVVGTLVQSDTVQVSVQGNSIRVTTSDNYLEDFPTSQVKQSAFGRSAETIGSRSPQTCENPP
jgi:hypothetical protein